MGGRLDATNVIEKPLVTVITRIGLDHTEYLKYEGRNRREEAGLLKKASLSLFWEQEEEVKRGYCQKGP